MDIIVTAKHVVDPNTPPSHFKIDDNEKHVIPPMGIPPLMNGYDENALEQALQLKEKFGGKVTVISLGDDSTRDTLTRAIAMGADSAIHINDEALQDLDSNGTARALTAAIGKVGSYDLILCGRQASDTDAGQVLFAIAEQLGLPVVSPAKRVEAEDESTLTVDRIAEDGAQRVRVQLPALIGVSSELNEPRFPPMRGVMAARRAQIPVWKLDDLGIEAPQHKIELKRLYMETQESQVELINADTPAEAGVKLADKLKEVGLI